jgi:RimJ/RimL family protein N-acetyltransferase
MWDADPAIIALMGRRFEAQRPEEWLRQVRRSRLCRAWVIELGDQPVGEVELAQINNRLHTAEIRICVGESAQWGRGIGTVAMRESLRLAFGEMGLQTVYLRVFANNLRAIALYERMGFRKEGMLQPSERRNDPAPVVLMNLSRARWQARQSKAG